MSLIEQLTAGEIDAIKAGGPAMVEPLIAALAHKDGKVRENAIRVLALLEDERAIPPLIETLRNDRLKRVRSTAAYALGNLGGRGVIAALTHAAEDVDWHVRAAAARALGTLRNPMGIDPLVTLLDDDYPRVIASAVEALEKIGTPEALLIVKSYRSGDL